MIMQNFTTFISTVLAGIVVWWFHSKPKLYFYFNNFSFTATFPPRDAKLNVLLFGTVFCSLTILNKGSVSLKSVQIFHSTDVSHNSNICEGNDSWVGISVSPAIPYEFSEDGKVLTFKSLLPKDSITINYIYPSAVSHTTIHQPTASGVPMIRSEETIGTLINPMQSVAIPKLTQALLWLFIVVGFWVSIKFIISLIALVSLYTANSNVFC